MPLKENTKAPNFSALSTEGKKVTLTDMVGKKGLILYFYPKDLTPGCTTEACDFRDNYDSLKKAGYNVAGVSKDSVSLHQRFTEKKELNFPLLADESGEICGKYDVWKEKTFMGKKHMGIVRTTFIIDKDLKIRKIYDPVKVKGHVEQILEDIKSLSQNH